MFLVSRSKVYQCDRNYVKWQPPWSKCIYDMFYLLTQRGGGVMTSTATSQQSQCCSFSSHVVHLYPQVDGLTYCNCENKSGIPLRKQHEWDALFTWDVFQTLLPRWPFFPGFVPGVVHSFVSLRSPSPHLTLLHVGASWSCTHSRHAACQYAINPATFHFPWGLGVTEFLPQSFTAALWVCTEGGSALGSLFLYKVKAQKLRPIVFTFQHSYSPLPSGAQRGVGVERAVWEEPAMLVFIFTRKWSEWASGVPVWGRNNRREETIKETVKLKYRLRSPAEGI